ncbi:MULTISPECIES: fatty acid desaturase [unclassified Pseudomonas]|uniref:fatty acid desaturase n=1 Tax=unclassified Pseudomonas TaxID=196821 RepID=UPI000BD840F5|nr:MULTISPECIES: fatty acid desaturase [unclassified Pseudomonas]PVZ10330.1 fatty acid desaturase [Pseudomonas sp. URIL14HWK12:I12]PVZ21756.1 fatty acid desaturase [Pseudomonas sp. URIL14HWK12:I10]PVZ31161.1 fatty acid desaturase [Pseudomonas sp. URIL14HWK12:I11]SNZ17914.1 Fatty acid desaturase [Pseudomonas sp. URIL14HWK12:I9]
MARYLDDAHRQQIGLVLRTFAARTEWPTWLLLVSFYAGWAAVIFGGAALGKLASVMVLVPLLVLWMSLQHECMHGHPTASARLNTGLAYLPFAVWYPYPLYRDSHMAHHNEHTLTVPGLDPESRYVSAQRWAAAGPFARALLWANKTLGGRLALGVFTSLAALVIEDVLPAFRGRGGQRRVWLVHGLLVAVLLYGVQRFSALSALEYVAYASLPALAVTLIRSFSEHRPAANPAHRTVLNESRGLLSCLFLNLNLHLVHHDLPGLPWYCLPGVYRARRLCWIARNDGYVVSGYAALLRRYFSRPVDSPRYPGQLPV